MNLVFITFIATLGIVLGCYWMFVRRTEEAERRVLQKRMKPEDPARKSKLTVSDADPNAGPAIFRGLRMMIAQANMRLTVPGLLGLCAMTALVVGLVTWTLLARAGLAVTAGVLVSFVPYLVVKQKASSRMWKFEEQFPEAIDLIARALRAGHAFPTGLSMVASELGEPVGPEFKKLYDQQNFGMALNDAVRSFARRVPILDAKFFATAVLTQREAGGNLSGVLDNLASVIRERFKVKRQVKVISAHGRMTAAILSGLPPLVAAAQAVIAPDNFKLLFTDDLGVKMLIGAAVLQGVGMFAISKIIKIEYDMGALSPMMIASLAASFFAVALMTGAASYLVLEQRSPERRRLKEAVLRTAAVSAGPASLTDHASPVVIRIASFVPKSPKELNKIRRRLVRAGYHSMAAAVVFSVAEVAVPIVLVVPVLLFVPWPTALLVAGFAGLVGFMVPSLVLGHLIEKRRKIITNGLPDVLDLLIVCLEAGSSLDQAILKASEELGLTYPPLGEELRMLTTETRAGKPRIEAFRNFEARTKNEDVKSLVAMLVQTDRFGTSVSQALKTFADVARTKRRQRAEEQAAKVGVKMVFPLVLCLFPALYVVTLGPAVIQILRVFIQGAAR